jgi:hypothetical protein
MMEEEMSQPMEKSSTNEEILKSWEGNPKMVLH